MTRQKQAVSIQDISCIGRCSLTVALPILSAAGIATAIVPTAILSTHTGGFKDYTFRDLTDDIMPIAKHWLTENIEYDAIYTGYLGSFEQIEIVKQFFELFRKQNTLIYVDPAMADNGKLYTGFTPEFALKMGELCAQADVIVPNITEACFMLGEPYQEGPYTQEYIDGLLDRLAEKIGAPQIVLTGVMYDKDKIGAAIYDTRTGEKGYASTHYLPYSMHGTGDVYASALLGGLMNGYDLQRSAQIAANYTVESMEETYQTRDDLRYGVNFETTIPSYLKALGRI
ncbi:MAG: pyridoxamine kinase [Selenomonadales bacterium]|jgi:pyridoxine kinase|nr:pyridoxamine kinase [Selenomonadales bacterium]MBQ5746128.1 pyridoxamine kinase [Selenomonadales bacterium]MBR0325512.1 pyridoxamine kinase [Selenomonadales bacterium]